MTTQSNLPLIWAETGGVTDPGDAKYSTGWIAEIPTFQNFNFVLQNHSKNFLVLAEGGTFKWEDDIEYFPGAQVIQGTTLYTCITQHTNQDPTTDTTYSYWVLGYAYGTNSGNLTHREGLYIYEVNTKGNNTWDGNDITIQNNNALIALNTQDGNDNLVFGNVAGDLVVQSVGTETSPDGRTLLGNNKIFHEQNPPIQSQVAGTIPENPQDGILYGRRDANWVEVTATKVQEHPPQPVVGNGSGWYNLQDGQLYVDIDDGDSSQWVPSSVQQSFVIEPDINIARAGRKNILINGILGTTPMTINQRVFDGNWAGLSVGDYGYDRWKKSATANSIDQVVEEGNFVPSADYVLSGVNVVETVMTAPASGNWTITVPDDANYIQLEKVTTQYPAATEFEYRPIAEELALCQRYYQQGSGLFLTASTAVSAGISGDCYFQNTMRVIPTVVTTDNGQIPSKVVNANLNGFHFSGASGTSTGWITSFTADAEL